MEYQINKQTIQLNEVAANTLVEQSIEIDYMLPDYCPDIFKVLKVTMIPHILSEHISSNKLLIDGVTDIKVIYLSGGDGNEMHCIEQKQIFSKTVDLKRDFSQGYAMVRAKCDYVNCRAHSSRRLDIRGAVSLMIDVYHPYEVRVVCDCDELQVHKKSITTCNRMSYVSKEFSVKEELKIGAGNPSIFKILNYAAEVDFTDYKVLANKVICKGEILLHTLYLAENSNTPEIIDHAIPLSQIIDSSGITEEYICNCYFDVVKYDMDMQMNAEGKCESLVAELGIRAYCEAACNQQIEIIDDCYSTLCEVDNETEQHKMLQIERIIHENNMQKHIIKHNQSDISLIHDLKCQVIHTTVQTDHGVLALLSNLQISALACDNDGTPVSLEQHVTCEIKLCDLEDGMGISFTPSIYVVSCAYHMMSPNEIELRVELKIRGILYKKKDVHVIVNITPDHEKLKKRQDDVALRLYFANEGENIWNIAKEYNTSVAGILENNALENEVLSARGMIFIPIVD